MRYFALFSICILLLFGGCAHGKKVETLGNGAHADADMAQSESDDEFLDDGFLDDEFIDEDGETISDPLAFINRPIHHVNDKLYFWVLKPATKGYKVATSEGFRIAFSNFFRNLSTPIRLVNCTLQGKGKAAGKEAARFVVNSTVGILGFADFASTYPSLTPPPKEDMGQTFGVYGLGHGFYLVVPFTGPSSLRDTIGSFGDGIFNPEPYLFSGYSSLGAKVFKTVNGLSFRMGDYETIKDAAIDPYEAFRDAYYQHRRKMVGE